MNPDILFRFVLTLGIIAAGLGFYWLNNRRILGHAPTDSLGASITKAGKPIILYFTTPSCVPCKTVQKPAIVKIKEALGEMLQVVEIDATEQPDLAQRWGVLSVPTTFVIDSRGQARYVNHGVARAEKLLKQLQGL
jgi:thiol-disulfide isomerase/thioredoxin